MVTKAIRSVGLILLLAGLYGTAACAQVRGSRTYFNQDIFVAQGQQIHNAICVFCSVQVEGDLTGHVLVLFGNLNVTGRIEHGATVIGGNAVVDSQARIGGNALVIGGNAVYETDDSISGNAWVIGGHLSPVGGRSNRVHSGHRLSFGPVIFVGVAIAAFLLLSVLFVPRRRTDAV